MQDDTILNTECKINMKKIRFEHRLLGSILIVCLLVFIIFHGLFTKIDTQIIDSYFKIRGDLPADSNIVLILLTDSDVQKLGGWPISRDYYSYMIHILNELGAKVIGFDLFLGKSSAIYPEHDKMLAEFTQAAANIIYAYYFNALDTENFKSSPETSVPSELTRFSFEKLQGLRSLRGHSPALPLEELVPSAAGIGFSNLGVQDQVVRKVPLLVEYNQRLYPSFALSVIIQNYSIEQIEYRKSGRLVLHSLKQILDIPVDDQCRIHINYLDDLKAFQLISFLELLQNYQNEAKRLNLKDKLVLIAPNLTGLTNLKSIPQKSGYPPIGIHANIIHNIMHGCALKPIGLWWNVVFTVLLSFIVLSLQSRLSVGRGLVLSIGFILSYFIGSFMVFAYSNGLTAIFAPILTVSIISLTQFILIVSTEKKRLIHEHEILQAELSAKKDRLQEAENELIKLKEIEKDRKLYSPNVQSQQMKVIQLRSQIHHLEARFKKEDKSKDLTLSFKEIVHSSVGKMARQLELIPKVAEEDVSVLITGESGTGKELVARAIHQMSQRKDKPFVAINCGALPETLLESELFGHEKGSFTGANFRRQGRFEQANGGTLFLDEIAETSSAFQVKVLRVLQEKVFERLGGNASIKVDVRILAATNKNLKEELKRGNFREDLYYRLSAFPIQLPPLRQRKEDIPLLVQHFLTQFSGSSSALEISEGAMESILHYPWYGNVRELENVIQRAVILARSEDRSTIQRSDLPEDITDMKTIASVQNDIPVSSRTNLDDQILALLRNLHFSHSAINRIAEQLTVDRGTVTERFKGLCFKALYETKWDVDEAARQIVAIDDPEAMQRVVNKIQTYINKIKSNIKSPKFAVAKAQLESKYKGMPKHFHQYLDSLIQIIIKDKF